VIGCKSYAADIKVLILPVFLFYCIFYLRSSQLLWNAGSTWGWVPAMDIMMAVHCIALLWLCILPLLHLLHSLQPHTWNLRAPNWLEAEMMLPLPPIKCLQTQGSQISTVLSGLRYLEHADYKQEHQLAFYRKLLIYFFLAGIPSIGLKHFTRRTMIITWSN
jgi:hypothetical protein